MDKVFMDLGDVLEYLGFDDPKNQNNQDIAYLLLDHFQKIFGVVIAEKLTKDQLEEFSKLLDLYGKESPEVLDFFEKLNIDIKKIEKESFDDFARNFIDDMENFDFDDLINRVKEIK